MWHAFLFSTYAHDFGQFSSCVGFRFYVESLPYNLDNEKRAFSVHGITIDVGSDLLKKLLISMVLTGLSFGRLKKNEKKHFL